jgi:hypothetical protein
MEALKIKIAKDFSLTPGPRYIKEGEDSGELFRSTCLVNKVKEAIANHIKIEINLDGTAGYGTSFLEESFGGLIREDKIPFHALKELFIITSSEEPYLIDDIKQYLIDAYEESKLS